MDPAEVIAILYSTQQPSSIIVMCITSSTHRIYTYEPSMKSLLYNPIQLSSLPAYNDEHYLVPFHTQKP